METAPSQLLGRPRQVNIRDPTLNLDTNVSLVSVDARSSYKSRTIETGNSFLEGLELQQNTHVDDSKSIYYKNEFGCARYEQEVGADKLLA